MLNILHIDLELIYQVAIKAEILACILFQSFFIRISLLNENQQVPDYSLHIL